MDTSAMMILKSIVVFCASIAEESAYRGVGWAILSYSTGNHLLAAMICCLSFALAHWMQGGKSMLVISLIAGIMHGLVGYTESLVPAMIVHGTYDFIAIYLIAIEVSHQRQSSVTDRTEESGDE